MHFNIRGGEIIRLRRIKRSDECIPGVIKNDTIFSDDFKSLQGINNDGGGFVDAHADQLRIFNNHTNKAVISFPADEMLIDYNIV